MITEYRPYPPSDSEICVRVNQYAKDKTIYFHWKQNRREMSKPQSSISAGFVICWDLAELVYLSGPAWVKLFSQSLDLLLSDEGYTLERKGPNKKQVNEHWSDSRFQRCVVCNITANLTWLNEESLSEQLSLQLYWLLDWMYCLSWTKPSFFLWSSSHLLIKDSTTRLMLFFKVCIICWYLLKQNISTQYLYLS